MTYIIARFPRTSRTSAAALLALASCAALACHSVPTASTSASAVRRAHANLTDATGRAIGTVLLTQAAEGPLADVVLTGALSGLTPGLHGMHVHTVGSCDGAGSFASAGAHFNPDAHKHGVDAPDGPHAGDLPNVSVSDGGIAALAARTARVTLGEGATSLFDADGSALVVHAAPDDQRTDPSGNSGARIACGVVVRD